MMVNLNYSMFESGAPDQAGNKRLVSVILPAFNEAALIERNVTAISAYIQNILSFDWEIIIIDDGSTDGTGEIAERLCETIPNLRVLHHVVNMNLGNALRTGFSHSKGDYVITLDMDLSYSVEHIEKLLHTIVTTNADLVLASPYMKGGKITAVPFMRRIMSRWVNKLMSVSSQEKYHTFTCMVRAYKGDFIRSLNLKTKDFEIFPEIIYKSMILRARIVEIPAHLDWTLQAQLGKKRVSGIRIIQSVIHGLMASFILRPYIYFFSMGLFTMLVFMYVLIDILFLVYKKYMIFIHSGSLMEDRFSAAVALTFEARPHVYLIGGFLFVVALQLLIQGFSSLQSKRYYEELFHINTAILKKKTSIN